MAEGGRQLHALLVASNRVLRVSKGAPMWRAYVEYVNDMVIDGLSAAVANSLRALCELVDGVQVARGEVLPLLEVQLELAAPDVSFSPELGEAGGPGSIANRVQGWIKSFLKPCTVDCAACACALPARTTVALLWAPLLLPLCFSPLCPHARPVTPLPTAPLAVPPYASTADPPA